MGRPAETNVDHKLPQEHSSPQPQPSREVEKKRKEDEQLAALEQARRENVAARKALLKNMAQVLSKFNRFSSF